MSKDIRSFFKVVPKKTDSFATTVKKRALPLDSSDDDIVAVTPTKEIIKEKKTTKRRKVIAIDSDSEEDRKKEKATLKKVKAADVFGVAPVQQTKIDAEAVRKAAEEKAAETQKKHKNKSKKGKTEIGVHDDPNFEQTLLDLDDDLLADNINVLDKTIEEALHEEKIKRETPKKIAKRKHSSNDEDGTNETPKKNVKRKHHDDDDDEDTGIDKDQERYERRRHSAILYQKYLNRSGPVHHGEKDYPKGKPNCLKNLCFIRTGVLDSLDRDEFDNIIKEHGGRTVHSISKKVSYVVVGDEPGPAKLEKASSYGIPTINEDELLDMILVKSGMQPKYCKKKDETVSTSGDDNTANMKEEEKVSSSKSPRKEGLLKKKLGSVSGKTIMKEEDGQEKHDITSRKASSPKKEESLKKHHDSTSNNKKPEDEKKKHDVSSHKASSPRKEEPSKKHHESTSNIKKADVEKKKHDVSSHKAASPKKEESSKKHHSSTSSNKEAESPKDKATNEPKVEIKKEKTSPKLKETFKPQKEIRTDSKNSVENLAWTDKYKPTSIKTIIGQQGDKSNMRKLMTWLQNWDRNHSGKNKPKGGKPSPWAKNDDGAFFKCALLSGPPGVGKTTTATLVAEELGYDTVEFNASDTRSKKLLHDEVSQLLSTKSLAGFFKEGTATSKKHVLLMDEVDGMAGNEDRGGMQELLSLIKTSNIPIICMCNDRNHTKIRSLANYCFDLRFTKPKVEQIRGAMMSVCFKEGLKVSPNTITEIINGSGMDIRQTLTHLSLWTANDKSLSSDVAHAEAKTAKKDTIIGPWEVIRKVFSEEDHKTMSLMDKSRLFFYDYSIGPLFVQENYLKVVPHCPKKETLQRIADAADSISMGDLIDRRIRSGNNWSLLEVQAMYSSVLPGHYLEGHVGGQINFPGWLGKNSKRNKFQRLLSELQAHMRTSISGSRNAVNLDYIYQLRDKIISPLIKNGTEGVEKSLEVMHNYNLLREDLDSLVELSKWPRQKDPMAMLDSKVKSAFTRAYNKDTAMLPYSITSATIKKKASASTADEEAYDGDEDAELSNEEDNDDVTKDAMIKAKKPTKATEKKAGSATTKKAPKPKGGKKK